LFFDHFLPVKSIRTVELSIAEKWMIDHRLPRQSVPRRKMAYTEHELAATLKTKQVLNDYVAREMRVNYKRSLT